MDSWINASPGNRREFDALWQLWQKTTDKAGYTLPDIENDWRTVRGRVQTPPATHAHFYVTRAGIWKALTAIIAGGIITGIVLIKLKKHPAASTQVVRYSGATILKDSVPGGTVIIMDKQGIFRYPSTRQRMPDTAFLTKGKVYIQTAAMPFPIRIGDMVVHTGNCNLLLTNDSAAGVISIQVFRGVAEVQQSAGSYSVQEGHSLVYDRATRRWEARNSVEANSLFFATGVFSFTDASLKEVAAVLAKAYNVTILLNNPAIGNCRMTGQFDHLPIENILELIAHTLDVTYSIQQQGKIIYLNGRGCE